MNAKEHREATPLETILINAEDAGLNIGQTAKLIEEHFITKSKEEAGEISIKLQYVMRVIEYATQYGGMSERKLKMLWNNFVAEIDKLAAFGKEDEG